MFTNVGAVKVPKPMAFLPITSLFNAANHGTHMVPNFEIQIGSSLEPIICGEFLPCEDIERVTFKSSKV